MKELPYSPGSRPAAHRSRQLHSITMSSTQCGAPMSAPDAGHAPVSSSRASRSAASRSASAARGAASSASPACAASARRLSAASAVARCSARARAPPPPAAPAHSASAPARAGPVYTRMEVRSGGRRRCGCRARVRHGAACARKACSGAGRRGAGGPLQHPQATRHALLLRAGRCPGSRWLPRVAPQPAVC